MHMLIQTIGKSISYLDCTDKTGTFRGNLDIKTLGGAGFASQRTTQEDAEWDLSHYAGIELCIAKGDSTSPHLKLTTIYGSNDVQKNVIHSI